MVLCSGIFGIRGKPGGYGQGALGSSVPSYMDGPGGGADLAFCPLEGGDLGGSQCDVPEAAAAFLLAYAQDFGEEELDHAAEHGMVVGGASVPGLPQGGGAGLFHPGEGGGALAGQQTVGQVGFPFPEELFPIISIVMRLAALFISDSGAVSTYCMPLISVL